MRCGGQVSPCLEVAKKKGPVISGRRQMGGQGGSSLWSMCQGGDEGPGQAWHTAGTYSTVLAPLPLPASGTVSNCFSGRVRDYRE